MEDNLIISKDGTVWMDVTEKAKEVYASGLFQLYQFVEDGDMMVRIPIEQHSDIIKTLEQGMMVVIKVGKNPKLGQHDLITVESWSTADKIMHDGYIYVRYNDLRFCR